MEKRTLTDDQLSELEQAHGECSDRRMADRIKAVILLGKDWLANDVAEALLLDRGTVRRYLRSYVEGGLEKLLHTNHRGSQSYLDEQQQMELARELDQTLYSTTAEVIDFIYRRWGVRYTERGVNSLLHRLGFVYKKTKVIPGKADADAQREFLEAYQELKEEKEVDSPIYFADATHPQHNTQVAHAWVRRGEEREILSNTGRQRLNINGAMDVHNLSGNRSPPYQPQARTGGNGGISAPLRPAAMSC
jgi:transposase